MSESEDSWPKDYSPGPPSHLHALGVITITFASFQASLDALYLNRASKEKLPAELAQLYYFSLDETKRIEAIKVIFKKYEHDDNIKEIIYNLLEYFQWCQDCRNHLAHAERYPPSLGGNTDTLYLVKRVAKRSANSAYIKLTLDEVRAIADNIRKGVIQCADIHIYLRFRGRALDTIPAEYHPYVTSLPQKLSLPPTLELALSP